MTLAIHKRAAIVCEDVTHKGHLLEVEEFSDSGTIAYCKTANGQTLRTLRDVEWTSRDGIVYHLRGRNESGDPTVWRAVGSCARCSSPSVYATPNWDRPQWPEST